MDNLPKDNFSQNPQGNQNQNPQGSQSQGSQPAGEIFSNREESAYEAAAAPEEAKTDAAGQYQEGSYGSAAAPEELPQQTNMTGQEPYPPQPQITSENVGPGQPGGGYPPAGSGNGMYSPYAQDGKKKMMVIVFAVLIILFVVAFLFMAVLGKRNNKPVDQNIKLTYWGLWEDKSVMQPIIDSYQKSHPNITIDYVIQDQKQYRERLQAAIDRGDGPDIYRFHNTWIPMMINYLSPMPKTVYSDADYVKTFYPVVSDDLKVSGNYYGIPLEIDGLMLIYNENILKGANVPVPVTWDDVQNAVPKLTVKQDNKIVTSAIALGTAENIENFSDILGLMMLQNGTQMVKSLFACADPSSTTCATDALTFYHKFSEVPNNSWDDTLDNSVVAFAGGKVAMVIAPSWQIFAIQQLAKNTGLQFKTAPVPQLPCDKPPCQSVNWATYWVEGVSSKSKNPEAAWDFLKYLSQADTMKKLYTAEAQQRQLFGEPYSRVDLGKELSSNPYIAPLITEAPTMKSFYLAERTNDGDTGIDSSLIKYLKDAVNSLSQGTSPETAFKTADNGFKQIFTRFGISSVSQ